MSTPLSRGNTGTSAINAAIDDAATLDSSAVAGLPAASTETGKIRYVSNGAAGQPCLAYSNGANWLRIVLGAAVSAT